MTADKKNDAFQQALTLVAALHEVNKHELDEDTAEWLETESEISSRVDDTTFDLTIGRTFEGIFRSVQSTKEMLPETLYNRAQKKVEDQAAGKQTGKEPEKVPLIHRRLLRLYWMVRLAAEDLIEQNPRVRLGRILLTVEKDVREAFVQTGEGIKLPLAMLRKKQWDLLAEYGMGLTVEDIYDLRPPRPVIEWNWGNNLFVGILIGVVIGFILALLLFNPSPP